MYCEIKGILILDFEGTKIYSKYYNGNSNLSSKSGQDLFEKLLQNQISKLPLKNKENDLTLVDSWTVVYKMVNSLTVYIIGSNEENEIFMSSVLDTLVESLEMVYKGELESIKLLNEFDLLILTIDEMFEEGVVLTCNASNTTEMVYMRDTGESARDKSNFKESLFDKAFRNSTNVTIRNRSERK